MKAVMDTSDTMNCSRQWLKQNLVVRRKRNFHLDNCKKQIRVMLYINKFLHIMDGAMWFVFKYLTWMSCFQYH